MEPWARSDAIGKLRTPIARPPPTRLRPSTPVVDLTDAFPVFTIVAEPTIRPPSLPTETSRTACSEDRAVLITGARANGFGIDPGTCRQRGRQTRDCRAN